MTPTPISCGRCGRRVEEETTTLAIDRGPAHSPVSSLALCQHCSKSIDRWLAGGDRHRAREERLSKRRSSASGSGRHRPKHQSDWKQRAKRFGFYLCFVAITFGIAWYLLKNATAPPRVE
jgi:hypothetical protein